MIKLHWTHERAGKWLGLDGKGNEVTASRVQEGMIGTHGYYWVVRINREYIGQKDTLAEAKRFGAETLTLDVVGTL